MKCFVLLSAILASATAQYYAPGAGYYGRHLGSPLLRRTYVRRPIAIGHTVVNSVQPIVRARYAAPDYAAPAYAAPAPVAYAPAAPLIAEAVPAVPYAAPVAPVVAPVAPVVAQAPAVTSSQFHKQDEFGNYEYGYSNENSAKRESGNALTGVQGEYSYVDGNGLTQQVSYVADALGFRAAGTNIPVGPSRKRRQVQYAAAPVVAQYAPVVPQYAAYAAAPVAVAQPAQLALESVLETVQNNPGHATSYRVYN